MPFAMTCAPTIHSCPEHQSSARLPMRPSACRTPLTCAARTTSSATHASHGGRRGLLAAGTLSGPAGVGRATATTGHSSALLRLRSSRQRPSVLVRARADGPDLPDRAVAALPYLVPLFDGLRYGKFALVQTPFLMSLLAPLDPLLRLYTGIPFASLVVFFGIYIGIINNQNFSRYVRFNAMQSVLLDIILILPGVLEGIFPIPRSGFGLTVYMNLYNAIFWFVLVCWIYGTVSCFLGRVPRLPLVADAADQQVP